MPADARLEGTKELVEKLKLIGDSRQLGATMRASVREPMLKVKSRAEANIAQISPGKTPYHRTYRGNLVSAGFAAKSIRLRTTLSKSKGVATAVLGVLAEAFYALQFLEHGTVFIPAHPWLTPAFLSLQDETVHGVGSVLADKVEKIAKGNASTSHFQVLE